MPLGPGDFAWDSTTHCQQGIGNNAFGMGLHKRFDA